MIIEIVPYNPAWPKDFEAEAKQIKQVLDDDCLTVHHIGSTSVEGLAAKPIIDILATVKDISIIDEYNNAMRSIGYESKGEYGIPFRRFFTKGYPKKLYHLHIFEETDSSANHHLLFREYLRNNPKALQEYEALKKALALSVNKDKKPQDGIMHEYTLGKDRFIRTILNKAGFDSLRLAMATHFKEWEEYHRIRKGQIFEPLNIAYDQNHLTLKDPSHFHFVLLKGADILSVAHLEIMSETDVALRSLATDEPYKKQGFGRAMMELLERWLKLRGIKILKIHASLRAEEFYRKLGYDNMPFNDPSISKEVVNLGKVL